jgi:hypothetical protein
MVLTTPLPLALHPMSITPVSRQSDLHTMWDCLFDRLANRFSLSIYRLLHHRQGCCCQLWR